MCPSYTQLPALQQRQRHLCGMQVWHGSAQGTVLSSGHSAQLRARHSSAGFNVVLSSGHSAQLSMAQQCWVQHGAQLRARCSVGPTWCSAQSTAMLGFNTALSSEHGAQLLQPGAQLSTVHSNAQLRARCSVGSTRCSAQGMVHSSTWFNTVLSSEHGAQQCSAQSTALSCFNPEHSSARRTSRSAAPAHNPQRCPAWMDARSSSRGHEAAQHSAQHSAQHGAQHGARLTLVRSSAPCPLWHGARHGSARRTHFGTRCRFV